MPVFHIYRNGEKIASEEFDGSFFILETDDQRADYWNESFGKSLINGRRPVAWIWKGSKDSKLFGFCGVVFFPEVCEVLLDNAPLPEERDSNVIDFAGKEVRFLLHDCEFVCQFPPLEKRDQST